MVGVAVDKLGDKYPNVAKGANKVIEIINIPFEWVGEKAVNGYKYAKKELIEEISNKYGEKVGRKVEMYINRGEIGIANSLSKYAPTDKQEKALKFLEGIGVSKLAKDIAIGGVKKVFTKADKPHHKTHNDTGGHIENSYVEAMNGGKHSGWAEQYLAKPTQEIEKAIKSLEKQIELHQEKIKNPDKYVVPEKRIQDTLSKKHNLINKVWPEQIARQTEQKKIL